MLILIGDFNFDINDTSFEKFESDIEYRFSKSERINNFDVYQAVGKFEENITIDGTLIAKSQSQLKKFEQMAEKKEEQLLVLNDGIAKNILILGLNKKRSSFLKDGMFLKQEYSIKLIVVND